MEDYNEYEEVRYSVGGGISQQEYKLNGKLHRINGPALIRYFGDGSLEYEGYGLNGKLHRIDGPARIWYNYNDTTYDGAYFICGIKVSKEQFETPGFIDAFILEHS